MDGKIKKEIIKKTSEGISKKELANLYSCTQKEILDIIKENVRNRARKGMTRNKLASIFNVDVKTIGNWINELSSRDEYQNIIGQLSTIFPDEDKSAIEKILINYCSNYKIYGKTYKESYIKKWFNNNENSNKVDNAILKKEWKKIISKYKDNLHILHYFTLNFDSAMKIKINSKEETSRKIMNDLYNDYKMSSLVRINNDEKNNERYEDIKDNIETYFLKGDKVYIYVIYLSLIKYVVEGNYTNINLLDNISERFVLSDYLKKNGKEIDYEEFYKLEKYKFNIEKNLKNLITSIKSNITEKEIVIMLSRLVLEQHNLDLLNIFYKRENDIRKTRILESLETSYINNILSKKIEYIPETTLYLGNKELNKKYKDERKRNFKIDKSGKDKSYLDYRLFAIPLKKENKEYNYVSNYIHRGLFTILINLDNIATENINKLDIFYKLPNFFNEIIIDKTLLDNKEIIFNKVDLQNIENNTSYREYFKKILNLKEDIPEVCNTFERALKYINALKFSIDGNYSLKREQLLKDITNMSDIKERLQKNINL